MYGGCFSRCYERLEVWEKAQPLAAAALPADGQLELAGWQIRCEAARDIVNTQDTFTVVPTGEITSVEGTVFDFTEYRKIGQNIDDDLEQLTLVQGYDHNFVVDGTDGTLKEFAVASSPDTGITMKCSTDLPGFQLYAGNFLKHPNGKGGKAYQPRDGFCLETQFYPNSINEAGFPDCVFGPDREYDTVTVYQFI